MLPIELKSKQISNGETIAYRERKGGRRLLLLIHGNMSSSQHWDTFMEQFDPAYTIIAVDLRGFGHSSYITPIRQLKEYAEDLKAFVDALQLQRFSLMGWSTGGGVSMEFSAAYPDYVEKLILLCSFSTRGYPFYHSDELGKLDPARRVKSLEEMEQLDKSKVVAGAYNNRNKTFLRNLWNKAIYTDHQPEEPRYEAYLDAMLMQRNIIDIYHALNCFNMSLYDHVAGQGMGTASDIQAPTLVLSGKKDLVVPGFMAEDIIEDIGSKAELIVLEHCGHSPLTDDLDLVMAQVSDFINRR
jgi:pimeloyl-ACP methyl ester carboxylesterase